MLSIILFIVIILWLAFQHYYINILREKHNALVQTIIDAQLKAVLKQWDKEIEDEKVD